MTSQVEFAVRAQSEARVALAYEPTNTVTNFYEVIIGSDHGNDVIVEYTDENGQRSEEKRLSTPQLLTNSVYIPFWIRWTDGILSIGS